MMKDILSHRALVMCLVLLILACPHPGPAQDTVAEHLLPGHPPAQDEQADGQRMTANLDGIDLRDFILFVSRFTDRDMVYREDQIPQVTVSLHSQAAMTGPELMAVLERVLASNSLDLVAHDGMYYILQSSQAQQMLDPFDPEGPEPDDPGLDAELMTTVVQLGQRIPDEQLQTLLQPFASGFGMILGIPQARAVLLRDTRARVRKMREVLTSVLALEATWNVELLSLRQAQAGATARKVGQLYEELFNRGRIGETPVILPVEWSNALLAAGSDEQLEAVRGLLRRLDQIEDSGAGMSMYALKNAKAGSTAEVLRSLLQGAQAGEAEAQPVSEVVVSADEETNSVLVLADKQVQKQVEDIVAHLDRPLDQVFVEALIVETSLENSQDFGVEWVVGGGGSDGLGIGGFLENAASGLGPLLSTPGPPVAPGGFTVGALGNAVTYAGETFSTLGALISFMKSARDFNILSTPQIMTLDNSEAEIFVGENRPFMVSEKFDAQNNPIQTFEYRDVGIRLNVTPTVNAEAGMIRMQVEQDVQNVIGADEENTRPTTMNRNTRTNVQIPDGFTMVISGLMEQSYTQVRRGMPGLSRIPVLGWLFRRESTSAPKKTLMVFLTARIIKTRAQARELTEGRMDEIQESRRATQEYLQREFWDGGGHGMEHEFNLESD